MNSRDKSAQPFELAQSAEIRAIARDDRPVTSNPYSPAKEIDDDDTPRATTTTVPELKFPSLPRTVLRWTVVCCIAAAPSFLLGLDVTKGRSLGMAAAILTFICFYIAIDLISRHWPIRSNIAVRRTLVFVYASRIVISVIFPVGVFVDLLTGMGMMSLLNVKANQFQFGDYSFGAELAHFWRAYGMTFVHAILMNIVLFVWGLIFLPFIALFTSYRSLSDDSITLDDI